MRDTSEAFRLTFIGLFANIFIPAGAVGGDVVKAIPLTPGGVGTRDVVIKTLLSAWGITESSAVTAMIIYTAMLLLIDLLGGIAFFLPDKLKRRPE